MPRGWSAGSSCFDSRPLEETIACAGTLTEGPVILLDHADNSASGGTQDTVAVLREAIRQGLRDVAMFGICDPQAVEAMERAGVGERVTLELGGKVDMPAIGRKGEPLTLTGRVRAVTDGEFVVTVPMGRGTTTHMGKTAVLDTGNVQVVVVSRHTEPFGPRLLSERGHRADREALPDPQVPHPLPGRVPGHGQGRDPLHRGRGDEQRQQPLRVQAGAPADLSPGPGYPGAPQLRSPGLVTKIRALQAAALKRRTPWQAFKVGLPPRRSPTVSSQEDRKAA